jgi:hypothetical protein
MRLQGSETAVHFLHAGSSPTEGSPILTAGDYHFYQAADGQWLFLAPLDARILLSHYGSYEALPHAVTVRALAIDAVAQTEAVRRKMKFLGHLPLTGALVQSCSP